MANKYIHREKHTLFRSVFVKCGQNVCHSNQLEWLNGFAFDFYSVNNSFTNIGLFSNISNRIYLFVYFLQYSIGLNTIRCCQINVPPPNNLINSINFYTGDFVMMSRI